MRVCPKQRMVSAIGAAIWLTRYLANLDRGRLLVFETLSNCVKQESVHHLS